MNAPGILLDRETHTVYLAKHFKGAAAILLAADDSADTSLPGSHSAQHLFEQT